MLRKFGQYLLSHIVPAGLIACLCVMLPWPFSAIAALIVGLLTLEQGPAAGIVVLLWALLPAMATTLRAHPLALVFDTAFSIAVLVYLFALILRYWQSWRLTLLAVAGLGALVIFALSLLPVATISHATEQLVGIITERLRTAVPAQSALLEGQLKDHVGSLIAGFFAMPLLIAVIYLMLARRWQWAIKAPGVLQVELYRMHINWRVTAVLIAVLSVVSMQGFVWMPALLTVSAIPYLFAGYSVLLAAVASLRGQRWLWVGVLLMLTSVILLALQYAVLVITLIGVVDSLIYLRRFTLFRTLGEKT